MLRDFHGAHRGLVHGGAGVLVDLICGDRGGDAVPQLLHPHDAVLVGPQRRPDGKQHLGEVVPGAAAVAFFFVRVAVRQIAVQLAAGVYALDHHRHRSADLGNYLRHRLAGVDAAHVAHGDKPPQCGEGGERIGVAADPLHRLEIVHAHPAAIPEILHLVIFGEAHDGLVIGKHRDGEAVGLQTVRAEGLDLVQDPGGDLDIIVRGVADALVADLVDCHRHSSSMVIRKPLPHRTEPGTGGMLTSSTVGMKVAVRTALSLGSK